MQIYCAVIGIMYTARLLHDDGGGIVMVSFVFRITVKCAFMMFKMAQDRETIHELHEFFVCCSTGENCSYSDKNGLFIHG